MNSKKLKNKRNLRIISESATVLSLISAGAGVVSVVAHPTIVQAAGEQNKSAIFNGKKAVLTADKDVSQYFSRSESAYQSNIFNNISDMRAYWILDTTKITSDDNERANNVSTNQPIYPESTVDNSSELIENAVKIDGKQVDLFVYRNDWKYAGVAKDHNVGTLSKYNELGFNNNLVDSGQTGYRSYANYHVALYWHDSNKVVDKPVVLKLWCAPIVFMQKGYTVAVKDSDNVKSIHAYINSSDPTSENIKINKVVGNNTPLNECSLNYCEIGESKFWCLNPQYSISNLSTGGGTAHPAYMYVSLSKGTADISIMTSSVPSDLEDNSRNFDTFGENAVASVKAYQKLWSGTTNVEGKHIDTSKVAQTLGGREINTSNSDLGTGFTFLANGPDEFDQQQIVINPDDSAALSKYGINPNDVNKKVGRNIKVENPITHEITTISQSVNFKRTVTIDPSTKKVIKYSDWQVNGADNLGAYHVPDIAGYTPSQTEVKEVDNVKPDNHFDDVNITYTAKDQSFKIHYVDANTNKEISNQTVSGKTDQTVNISPKIPDGYVLLDGQNIPQNYKFTADNKDMNVKVTSEKKIYHNDPLAAKYDTKKSVTRTINVHTPHDGVKTVKQTVNFVRDVTVDVKSGSIKGYGNWEYADGNHTFETYTVPEVSGYKPSQVTVASQIANATDKDSTVDVSYTAENQEIKVHYQDDGKDVGTQTIAGKTDETVTAKLDVPDGYQLADGENASRTVTFKGDGNQDMTVKVNKIDKSKLENAIKKGQDTQKSDKYSSASKDTKKILDDAVTLGQSTDKNIKSSQSDVDTATKNILDAISNLDSAAKQGLNDSIQKGKDLQGTDKYKNASDANKKALNDAIAKGEDVVKNPNASQKDIDDAKKGIDDAMKALDKEAKKGLEDTIAKAEALKKSDKYNNVPDSVKEALENALKNAHDVDSDLNATKIDIDTAKKGLEDTIAQVDSAAKSQLVQAIKHGGEIKNSDKGKAASDTDKKALDDAIVKGNQVNQSPNANKPDIDNAVKAINDAISKLDKDAKKDLEAAIEDGKNSEDTNKYVDATPAEKAALKNAIEAGKKINGDVNATKQQIDNATKDINQVLNDIDDGAKAGLKSSIARANALKPTDKFKDSDGNLQDALTDAVKKGESLIPDRHAKEKDISNAQKAIDDAIAAIDKAAKQGLEVSIKKGEDLQGSPKYGSVSAGTKKVLDQALRTGETVDQDPNATEKAINDAKKAIDEAMTDLDKEAKGNLDAEIAKAKKLQDSDKGKAAPDDVKKALDDAIKNAEKVNNDPNASKDDIDKAKQALDQTEKALDKASKKQLEADLATAKKMKGGDKYNASSDELRKALDTAIINGDKVDQDTAATKTDIDNTDKDLVNSMNALDKAAKKDLEDAIKKGKDLQGTDKYKNASDAAKKALDDALANADKVDKDINATPDQIKKAKDDIDKAVSGLDKAAKSSLEDAIKKGQDAQKTDKYNKAPDDVKNALDDAIAKGEDVVKNPNATQKDIDDAKKGIEDAIKNLDHTAKTDLEKAIKNAQSDPAQSKLALVPDDVKKALNDALQKAQKLDQDPNAAQKDIDEATKNLNAQIAAVDKAAKTDLVSAIAKGQAAQKSNKYGDASTADKGALDTALQDADKVNQDPNATAYQIQQAVKALNDASAKIDGLANKDVIKSEIDKAKGLKDTDKYKDATDEAKKALDTAIDNAEKAVKNPNVTQQEVDDALNKLKNAEEGLDKAHKNVTIDPNNPIEEGELIPGTDIKAPKGLGKSYLNRTVTRTINWKDPKGNSHTEKQTVNFKRSASIDLVTKKITYTAWSLDGHGLWAAFQPKVEGYKVNGLVQSKEVTPDTKSETVTGHFTYTKNNASNDKNGNSNANHNGSNGSGNNSDPNSGSNDSGKDTGFLPKTGHFIVKHATALAGLLIAAATALGAKLYKNKREEKETAVITRSRRSKK